MENNKYIVSREDLLERYTDKYTARITNCYQNEWDRYVNVCKLFLQERMVNNLKVLLVDHIEPIPLDLNNRFTPKEKTEFSIWMFKSAVLCVNEKNITVGTTLEHDLPVGFKIYINKNRQSRLINDGLPKPVCIKDFNTMVELITSDIKKKLEKLDFDISYDTADAIAGTNNYEFFTIYLKMKRKYNKSEDLLIRSNSIETLNKYYNRLVKNTKSSMSTEGIIDTLFITVGGAFLISGIAKMIKFFSSGSRSKNIEKMIKENVTVEEINFFNEYFTKFKKDIQELGKDYKTKFYKNLNKECRWNHIFKDIITADPNFFFEHMYDHKKDLKKGKMKYTPDFLGPVVFGYEIPYSEYDAQNDDGSYSLKSDNPNLLKCNKFLKRYVEDLEGKTLSNSKTKIKALYSAPTVYHNENLMFIKEYFLMEPPKVVSEKLVEILTRIIGEFERSNESYNKVMSSESFGAILFGGFLMGIFEVFLYTLGVSILSVIIVLTLCAIYQNKNPDVKKLKSDIMNFFKKYKKEHPSELKLLNKYFVDLNTDLIDLSNKHYKEFFKKNISKDIIYDYDLSPEFDCEILSSKSTVANLFEKIDKDNKKISYNVCKVTPTNMTIGFETDHGISFDGGSFTEDDENETKSDDINNCLSVVDKYINTTVVKGTKTNAVFSFDKNSIKDYSNGLNDLYLKSGKLLITHPKHIAEILSMMINEFTNFLKEN